jgi:hypothetical protein
VAAGDQDLDGLGTDANDPPKRHGNGHLGHHGATIRPAPRTPRRGGCPEPGVTGRARLIKERKCLFRMDF